MTSTDFAPITFNGEPVATWRTATEIVLDGHLYFVEFAASQECSCNRCILHDDFGGCYVAEALWGLVEFLTAPIARRCGVCAGCRYGFSCERTGAE